ncbi:MAG: cation diffusion facilitator family transporter [Mycobacteriaceae bacterium]
MSSPPETSEPSAAGESTATVLVAGAANLGVAIMKLVAGVVTGSAALLAEAVHSLADTVTEVLLLTALRRSDRPADRAHPLGYGKERFFWALIAAVSIFVSGAVFALYEGVHTIVSGEDEQRYVWVAYLVIAISAALEGTSWLKALRQARAEAAGEGRELFAYLRTSDDPTVKTVFYEDSAALIGLLLALLGTLGHQLTGSGVWDGVASLLIGVLLALVAYLLGSTTKSLLVGRQADVNLVRAVRAHLAAAPEVDAVVDLITQVMGTNLVLVCARIDLVDGLSTSEVEKACLRLDGELQDLFAEVDEVFLEPVPRGDPDLRAKVLARYGELDEGFRLG